MTLNDYKAKYRATIETGENGLVYVYYPKPELWNLADYRVQSSCGPMAILSSRRALPIAAPRAWTGGKRNAPYKDMTPDQRRRVRQAFRHQVELEAGRTWFFSTPNGVLDYARILWNRARLDTWASLGLN